MVSRALARTIVGIVGNVLSFFLFISPAPTFVQICKSKSVQQFKPDPYVATLLNCAMWVFYGLPFVHPNSLLVVTINGIGFGIEIIYIAIFLVFSDWPKRKKIIIIVIIEAIFMAIVVAITLFVFEGTKIRSMFVGILCIIFNVIMYASPLTVMRSVIKTKSVKYMPFYLALASFVNAICWLAYALIIFDPYVTVPNGLGTISGAVQLILYAMYYKSTNWNEDEKPSEVQVTQQA